MAKSYQQYTFLPETGALYQGSIDERTGSQMFEAYLASFDKVQFAPKYDSPKVFGGAVTAEEKAYVANALGHKAIYTMTDVRPDLYEAQKLKMKIAHLERVAKGRGMYDASISRELARLKQQYQADNMVNSDNTSQLTIVPFVNNIIGHLEQPSYIAAAFKNIPLDKLRGKIPEMGWPTVQVQQKRLQEPEITATEFGQYEFRIFRNDIYLYMSREDRMEATIDPFATSIQQGNIQMMRARELLALKALSGLQVNATYGTLPDPTVAGTAGLRSGTDSPDSFVNVIVQHFSTWKNYLKYFVFHPNDYRAYLSNWYSHGYTELQVPEGFGVVPFKGLEKYGAVAIISPYVPRSCVYALGIEGAYELDGPKIVDAEYDVKKFADLNVVHDFIGYQIVNPSRYGEKLNFPIAGVTAGTEITTDKQIADALAAPSNAVTKKKTTS